MKDVFSQMYFLDAMKTKVCRNGNYVYPVPVKGALDTKEYLSVLEYCKVGTADGYMNHAYVKHTNDSVFEENPDHGSETVDYINRWRTSISISLRRISRLRDLNSDPIEFYLRSDHYSARIVLVDDRVEGNSFICHMYISNDIEKFVQLAMISIVTDQEKTHGSGAILVYGASTTYVMSPSKKTAESIASGFKSTIVNGLVGIYETYLIDVMIRNAYDCIKDNMQQTINFEYNAIEMWMFRTIMKDLGYDGYSHRIFTWAHEEDLAENLFTDDQDLPKWIVDEFDTAPLVDFSMKEWKFIDGFCKRNNLFEEDPTNMLPYFMQPRYGKIYRMEVDTSDGTKVPLVISFKLDEERKYLKMYIVEKIDDNTFVYATVDCTNIDQYKSEDSVRRLSKHVAYMNLYSMRSSVKELMQESSLLQSEITNTSSLVGEVFKMFAIMYLRPDRSRMVKCVQQHDSTRQTKHGVKHEHKETIWRILKPIKDAKEYVSKMSGTSRGHVEYTLEEWPRVGHTRTLESGKVIWIPATTCRRHEDLLNKDREIKIKL